MNYKFTQSAKRFIAKSIVAFFFLGVFSNNLNAQSCVDNTLYVSPDGKGIGSKLSPANLITALAVARDDTSRHSIKMSVGTYNINQIVSLSSNLSLEGNYEVLAGLWTKSNTSKTILNISSQGEIVNTITSDNKPIELGHYIGIKMDSVKNIILKDFKIEVLRDYYPRRTYEGDGYSVYGIFGRKSQKINLINLEIVTANGEDGYYGYDGLSGADAYYNIPGKTEYDPSKNNSSYRPKPSQDVINSFEFRAGGSSGSGAGVQRYYRCLSCPSSATSASTSCAMGPVTYGGTGGKGGGTGGKSGDGCEMDCYYEFYKSKAFIKDEIAKLLNLPNNGLKDPNPKQGADGANNTGVFNGPNYNDQTYTAYDDMNYYYIPGVGAKGGDGSGGGGGGGGGAGGIRTLGLVPEIPGLGDYNLPAKAMGIFNKTITLIGGDDVCNAEVVNGSTEGGQGGAGGEGGEGGGGGRGGGASIGVFTLGCQDVTDNNCIYTIGEGGKGGSGGLGGKGGNGGLGLPGRAVSEPGWSFQGAKGGNGGKGADGSRGQHGSNGKTYKKLGVSTRPAPFIMSDVKTACTNSVINLYTSANPDGTNGSVISFRGNVGSSEYVLFVNDLPNGRSFNAYSPFVQVYADALGTLPVSFTNPVTTSIPSTVKITSVRPLPSMNVPSVMCYETSVTLKADSAFAYLWKIFDASGKVLKTSTDRSIVFNADKYGIFTVGYQAYDQCCGFSIPQYRNIRIPKITKPTISKMYVQVPYCQGLDSTWFEVSNASATKNVYNWSNGKTGTKIYVKTNGNVAVTFTDPDSKCTATSDSLMNEVYDAPTGPIVVNDQMLNGCDMREIYIQPDYEPGIMYNFYSSSAMTRFSLLSERKPNYVTIPTGLYFSDSTSYYIRKVKTYYWGRNNIEIYCPSLESKKVTIHREKTPPAVLKDNVQRYIQADANQCGATYAYQFPAASDACSGPIQGTPRHVAANRFYPIGKTVDTIRYKDFYGNILDYPIEIIVFDSKAPVITKYPGVYNATINNLPGKCSGYFPYTIATAVDNCTQFIKPATVGKYPISTQNGGGWASFDISNAYEKDSMFNVGVTNIRQMWQDANRNFTMFEQTVTVRDNEAPKFDNTEIVFYVPKNKKSTYVGYNPPVAPDNCGSSNVKFISGFGQFGEHAIGSTTEVWSATDGSGNVSYSNFKLTVKDTIAPSIDCSKQTQYFKVTSGLDSALATFAIPLADDNSQRPVTVAALGKGSGSYFKLGQHQVTYIATDSSGNKASCNVSVVVLDQTAPVLTCPSNIKVGNSTGVCGAVVNFTILKAHDNEDGLDYTPQKLSGLNSGQVFPLGITRQVYTVADGSGNKAWCSFDVTVKDSIAPVFTNCPGNIVQNVIPNICGGSIAITIPTATDNSCLSPSQGFVSGSLGFFPVGITHQVFRATDASGNSTTCEYDVTIVDNTTLSVVCPSDMDVDTDPGVCGKLVTLSGPKITPFYGCTDIQQTFGPKSGTVFIPGPHQVKYTVTALGQTQTCSFYVNVNDKEVPKINSMANIVTHVDNGACGKAVTFTAPIGVDNCTNVVTQRSKGLASGSIFPIGTTVQKYISFDILNLDSSVFSITVLDTIAPSFTDKANMQVTTAELCGSLVTFSEPVASDNSSCFKTTRIAGLASGSQFPVGTTKQVYVVEDNAHNTDTTSFNVKVIFDSKDPKFYACPPDVVQPSLNDQTLVVWYDIPGRVNCTGVSTLLTSGLGSGATFPVGITRESYVITTAAGDTQTCSFRVIITEQTPPLIDCGAETFVYPIDSGTCGAKVILKAPPVYDAGGIQVYFSDKGALTDSVYLPAGSSSIMWTAIDNSSNRSSCYSYVKVGEDIQLANPFPSRLEVCEGATFEYNPSVMGKGPYTYTWRTYDDDAGMYISLSTDSIFKIDHVKASDQKQYQFLATNSCQQIYLREFFLKVNPAPTVTLTGLSSGYCIYDSTAKPLSFSPADGVLVGQGLTNKKFNPALAGVGEHLLSYVFYDSTLACASTATLKVNVYDQPKADPFIDTAYCINHVPIQLNDTNSVYSGAGITGSIFKPSVAQAGTHTIKRTVTVNGCVNSLSQKVRINGNIPNAKILSTGSLCSNQHLVKLETATAGGKWSGDPIYVDSIKNISYFNVRQAVVGSNKIKYKIIQDVCSASDSASIVVKDASYGLPYTLDGYCYDQGLVSLDISDNKTYFGYGIKDNKFDPMAYDTSTTAFYGVATLNANGCRDTVMRMLAVLKPEIKDPIAVICGTIDSVKLALDPSAFTSVKWFDNSTAFNHWVSQLGNYSVDLHNSIGCSHIDTFHVINKQRSLVPLINSKHLLYKCLDNTIDLNVDPKFTVTSWSTGATQNKITVKTPGKYTVFVKDANDCSLNDTILLKEYESIQNNKIVNKGYYLEAINSTSYQWYKEGVIIPSANSKTYVPTVIGNYSVSLLDSNGCMSNSATINVQVLGVDGPSNSAGFLIYPNPGKGKYILEFTTRPKEDIDVIIYNALGHTVAKVKILSSSNVQQYDINIQEQPDGVYWAHILSGDSSKVSKIVKVE